MIRLVGGLSSDLSADSHNVMPVTAWSCVVNVVTPLPLGGHIFIAPSRSSSVQGQVGGRSRAGKRRRFSPDDSGLESGLYRYLQMHSLHFYRGDCNRRDGITSKVAMMLSMKIWVSFKPQNMRYAGGMTFMDVKWHTLYK